MRLFDRIAGAASRLASHPLPFMVTLAAIVLLNVAGLVMGQLKPAYDVGGSIAELIALLLLFLLHHSGNEDTQELHEKLDRLLERRDA